MQKNILDDIPVKLTDFDIITVKKCENITFGDVICLFFYALDLESQTALSEWVDYYSDFLQDCKIQSEKSWPKIRTVKNYFHKRVDFLMSDTIFIKSSNFLTLLYRLFYIESEKKCAIITDNYVNVLDYQPNSLKSCIKNVTISMLIESLKICLQYYQKIYNDSNKLENKLVNVLLSQL